MNNARLLIVHSSSSALALLRSMLYAAGIHVDEAVSDREAVRMLERTGADLVLSGVDPVDPDGLELLAYVRRKHPQIPVLLLFATPHQERTRDAMQRGAAGVLRFPLPATELRAAVAQALEHAHVAPGTQPVTNGANGKTPATNGTNASHVSAKDSQRVLDAESLIGGDAGVQQALELAMAIAPMRTPALILGERGTGKNMLARSIHRSSPRNDAPFIDVACGSLKELQLERELFGMRTGFADRGPELPGKLAQANGGTLFLDEVAALTPEMQFKLLRVIQEMAYEPINSTQTVRVDVRVIMASCEDLSSLVAQGRLRQDLYDRIGAVCIKLPPVRQRGTDIELLAQHFRARQARQVGKEVIGFTPEALVLLSEHRWPGNVRELQTVVERAVAVCRGPMIAPSHLVLSGNEPGVSFHPRPHSIRAHAGVGIRPLKEALEDPEKQIILHALEALNWNRQETARVLDINRTTLYKKMKKYGLLSQEPAWMN